MYWTVCKSLISQSPSPIRKRSKTQNKTKQNAATRRFFTNQGLMTETAAFCFVLFCWLARAPGPWVVDHRMRNGCRVLCWHPEDSKMVPHLSVPATFLSKMARNGSGIHENQHELVRIARNFGASPAVTTGGPQDPYFWSKLNVSSWIGQAGPDRPGRQRPRWLRKGPLGNA